jgi:hypothetical protein
MLTQMVFEAFEVIFLNQSQIHVANDANVLSSLHGINILGAASHAASPTPNNKTSILR